MENLVRQAMQKNADAFTTLMRNQMQNMYKTARAILYSDEDIADAIQDTILTCWEKLSRLEEPMYFRTWMTRILINKCNDILRAQKKFVLVENLPETPAPDLGFSNLEWIQVLERLKPKDRIVVILYYVEGFKTSEIAQMLEMSESTVRGTLARSREKLATEYDPEIKEEKSV